MLALIAVVAFSAVSFFGTGGKGQMGNNANCLGEAMGTGVNPDIADGVCTSDK